MIRVKRCVKIIDMHQRSMVAEWHIQHGWCYNVEHNSRHVGMFYVTLLGLDAGILHFELVDNYLSKNPIVLKCAFKTCFDFARKNLKTLFVSPPDGAKLEHTLAKFGFKKVTSYNRVALMQLF